MAALSALGPFSVDTYFPSFPALVAPVVTIQSRDLFPQRKGLASSLQGFAQILVFALISSLGARLVYRSGPKHATGLAVMMGRSGLAYYGFQKQKCEFSRLA
ncbi:MAG TPA: hypothetical protein VNT26_23930 [Candidatus Sulfotelmatobacter sp.]|nr:hypothetical protein [Candidatus Sulfotelmatobacter sp.]